MYCVQIAQKKNIYTKEKLQYVKKTLCLPLIGFCTKYKIDSLTV